VLDDNLAKLNIHYKTLLSHQAKTADAFYNILIHKKEFKKLFEKAGMASLEQKVILRDTLKKLVQNEYNIMKNNGVLQFQFVFPNNISFLRMHKPSQYGDDLSSIRHDFNHTNKTYTISRALVAGRTIHGFRNVYPIFSNEGKHLGALDISFASESFQNELTEISGIHAHFLISKKSFLVENLQKNDFTKNYTQSSEHVDYMMCLTKTHNRDVCIVENTQKLAHLKDVINQNMDKGDPFSFYTRNGIKEVEVISFLPIKSFTSDKAIGWLISYNKNKFIYDILKSGQLINVFSFLILVLFAFFIYHQILAEIRIKKEHTLLDDVVNTTEDIIFMTNFKTASFVNKGFKNYMSVDFISNIKDITTFFVDMKGYLHNGLLNKNETFYELIINTAVEDRVVCILDSSLNPKAFSISVVESSYKKGDFLVTLTDITKLKEKESKISNKAFHDGLTGVYNRNKFDDLIDIELKRDKRYNNYFTIAIIDIDHFKKFNDTYGHLIGDEVLIMIAQYLDSSVRDSDIFARWGGEEFVILFPETTAKNAEIVCEKLRKGVLELHHNTAGPVTASFGITQYKENDVLESLFKRCDDALYEAKETGRNKVLIH